MIDLRTLPERWRRWPVTVRDLPPALLLGIASVTPTLDGHGTQVGELPTRPFDTVTVAVVALECLPLAVRRRWPALCLALVSLGFALDQLRGYHTVAGSALPIALVSTAVHLDRYRRVTVVATSAAYVLLALALDRQGSPEGVTGFVTFALAMALAWGTGVWLRRSRAAEAELRRHVAESTRTAERTRIARDLHDVVTHHVTAMVVQAEAARYLTASPDRLDESLTAISGTGRRAIADLRHLLDLLNPDHRSEPRTPLPGAEPQTPPRGAEPQTPPRGAEARTPPPDIEARTPPADELRALVERTRRAGQPIELTQEGRPQEPAGSAEAVAYRVVQEALTNALKYDHGGRTVVHVRYGPAEISVRVSSEGAGSGAASPGGSGRGLAGLRDRVGVLGGDFSAGGEAGGGFVVHARIPAGSPS